ncbi:MAG: glycosyltransferase family 39 protein [Elusimicrobia bacterium]|nr:glycosyltransferase family 39 protein [Elusimicrobiota bacterium]
MFHLIALLISGVALHLNQPWINGIAGWDDSWYAAGAVGMLDTGEYLTPMYNLHPTFFTAPPMTFWMLAIPFKILGNTTFAAKFTGGLATLIAVFSIFIVARRLFKSDVLAAMAAMVFNMDPFVLKYGHHALAHTAWAATVTLAMGSLYEARRKPIFYLAFSILTAVSILFKSVLGLFPVAIGGLWLFWDKAKLKELLQFAGAATLGIILGGSWFWVEYMRFGDIFLQEHLGDMLLKHSGVNGFLTAPLHIFENLIWPLAKASFSGLLLLPFGIWSLWSRRTSESRLLLIWILVPIACLGLTIRPTPKYMAPAFAGMAIAVGHFLEHVWSVKTKQNSLTAAYLACFIWALATLIFPIRKGRDFLAETQPLIHTVQAEVPPGDQWLLVVGQDVKLFPEWPNRMLVEYTWQEGPLNRGVVNQILFYTRRGYEAVHPQDLRHWKGKQTIVFSSNKDMLPGSNPRLNPILLGPDWTLYRLNSPLNHS